MQLRIISLGMLSPELLHKTYVGLAEAQSDSDLPILLLVQSAAHLSLGAAQSAGAELDLLACKKLGVPVLQRSLGGGLVWVDGGQLSYFFIFPTAWGMRRAPELFDYIAPWIVALYAHFGVFVEARDGHDFWCAGRKIAGTGAASIGRSLVLGGSIMLHVDWQGFVACVAAPSEGFRAWLAEALGDSVWTWSQLSSSPPTPEALRAAFPRVLEKLGVQVVVETLLSRDEQRAVAEAEGEEPEWEDCRSRRVAAGIKIKAGAFLTERHWPEGQYLRIWTENGCFRKVKASLWAESETQIFSGLQMDSRAFNAALQQLAGDEYELWAARFAETAVWKD